MSLKSPKDKSVADEKEGLKGLIAAQSSQLHKLEHELKQNQTKYEQHVSQLESNLNDTFLNL